MSYPEGFGYYEFAICRINHKHPNMKETLSLTDKLYLLSNINDFEQKYPEAKYLYCRYVIDRDKNEQF